LFLYFNKNDVTQEAMPTLYNLVLLFFADFFTFIIMMRLDSRTAKDLVNRIRSLLQEKSYKVANNVRNKVNSVMDPEAAANGAVVNKKLISAREWYEEFTGIDLVRAAQERVVVVINIVPPTIINMTNNLFSALTVGIQIYYCSRSQTTSQ
jgi:hypothetical protein